MNVERTHILAWVPGSPAGRDHEGWWELRTLGDLRARGCPRGVPADWRLGWPRDAGSSSKGFQALHRWVAERLGWCISLEEGGATTWRPWPPQLPRREPVYYIWQVAA